MTGIEKTKIKEMFNIMGKATETNLCHKECFIDTEFDNECSLCRSATALFKAGYRKQSDTVREFVEKLKTKFDEFRDKTSDLEATHSEALTLAYYTGVKDTLTSVENIIIKEIAASLGELCPEFASCATCERRNKTADLSSTILCSWLGNKTMNKTDYCSYYLAAEFGVERNND